MNKPVNGLHSTVLKRPKLRSIIRCALTVLMVLVLMLPAVGNANKAAAQTPAPFIALGIFAQVPLNIPAPLAASPKADTTVMPGGLPAGSIALIEILGVVNSVDSAGLEWGIGNPPVLAYKASGTKVVGAPRKGDLVKVSATRTIASGPLVAEEIVLRQAGPVAPAEPQVELSFMFNGVMGTTSPHIWKIGGADFIVDDPMMLAEIDPGVAGNVTVQFTVAGTVLSTTAPAPAPISAAPAFSALGIFAQVPLTVPVPLAASPKVDTTVMPGGLPAGSIALIEILGVVNSVDSVGLEWGIGNPPVLVYKASSTQVVGAIKKGDLVKVSATRTIASGPLVAEEIVLRQAGPVAPAEPQVELSFMFNGVMGTTSPHIWKIGGADFIVDDPMMLAEIDPGVAGNVTVQFVIAATALQTLVTQNVAIAGATYAVNLTEFNPGGRVAATVTMPDGTRVNYSSNWQGFTADQVLANAIATKDFVAQAVALAAGAKMPQAAPQVKEDRGVPPVTPASNEASFTDIVNKISGPIWIVGTTTVLVVDSTRLDNLPMEGDTVNVRGQLQADGSVLASRIRTVNPASIARPAGKPVEPAKPAGTETRLTGKVNGTGNNMWLIGISPVAVDANTRMHDNPVFGSTVEVRGYQQKDGTVLATQIRNLGRGGGGASGGGSQVRFTATVDDVAATSWVIGGFTVTVNSSTKIIDNPREGDSVEIVAIRQTDGTLLATEIRNSAKAAIGGGTSGSGSSGSGSGSSGSGSGSSGSGSSGSSGSGSGGSGGSGSGSGSGSGGSGSGGSGSGGGGSGSGGHGSDD